MIYLKKIKRKCMNRGCKNIDTYAMSKTREMGNSIYMCRNCIEEAFNSVQAYTEPEKPITNKVKKPLFFNSFLSKGEPTAIDIQPKLNEVIVHDGVNDLVAEVTPNKETFVCEYCGKECASKIGLISHQRNCSK